jgi:hypothetical protein
MVQKPMKEIVRILSKFLDALSRSRLHLSQATGLSAIASTEEASQHEQYGCREKQEYSALQQA